MKNQISIIYSAALGTIRRIVIPTFDDSELDHPWNLPTQGEVRVLVPKAEYEATTHVEAHRIAGAQRFVNAATGRTPEPHADRFAVVAPDGKVVSAIVADPACGAPIPPGHALVQHPEATHGWSYRGGRWSAPPAE